MRPEEIRDAIREQPFRPLRLFLSDGSAHDVRHPEMLMITRRSIFLAIQTGNGDEVPENYVRCDPVHVTRIEPIAVDASS